MWLCTYEKAMFKQAMMTYILTDLESLINIILSHCRNQYWITILFISTSWFYLLRPLVL